MNPRVSGGSSHSPPTLREAALTLEGEQFARRQQPVLAPPGAGAAPDAGSACVIALLPPGLEGSRDHRWVIGRRWRSSTIRARVSGSAQLAGAPSRGKCLVNIQLDAGPKRRGGIARPHGPSKSQPCRG